MPFGTLLPLPGSSHPAPPPLQPDASPPQAGLPRHGVRLDELPPEIVLRVAQYLSPRKALALGAACHGIFDMLRTDVIDPLRLRGRIRWVSSLSAFEAALSTVRLAPKAHRDALFGMLGQRLSVLPDPLREPARIALRPDIASATPSAPNAGYARHPAWLQLVQSGIADDPEGLLPHILASPPDTRSRLLETWLESLTPPPPPVRMWAQILDAVPAPAQARILARMAREISAGEFGEGMQTVIAAVHASVEWDGVLPADHADVLVLLAEQLVWNSSSEAPATLGQFWDQVFALARRLPLPVQPDVMSGLTGLVHLDDVPSTVDPAAQPGPRWSGFIEYVCVHFAPAQVHQILGDLARSSALAEDGGPVPGAAPLSRALSKAAAALPETWRAKMLATILDSSPADKQATLALWDNAFRDSEFVAASIAAPLYVSLAAIQNLPGAHQAARWEALCQRLGQYADIAPLMPAMVELAEVPIGARSIERRAMLLRIGSRLPAKSRGRLAVAMTLTRDITPALWRAQVMELEDLPRHVRHRAAKSLCITLFRYGAEAGAFQLTSPQRFLPDPNGLAAAEFPRTAAEALNRLSDILVLLPLADRGRELLSLSQQATGHGTFSTLPWSAARLNWLLHEVCKLAPLHHHGIDVVTNVARSAARRCPSEAEALAVLPALRGAVAALPVEARVSALFYLTAMAQRLVTDKAALGTVNELWAGLPEADLVPLRSRKRKEPPGDAAG